MIEKFLALKIKKTKYFHLVTMRQWSCQLMCTWLVTRFSVLLNMLEFNLTRENTS